MQIKVPLAFLDTLGITPSQKNITDDFSDYLLHMLKLFDGMEQPIWTRLLLNTSFDLCDQPNALQSNGVGVLLGVEKLQELMALPPDESVVVLQNILENTARLATAQKLGLPFETSALEIVDDTQFGAQDAIRHQHTFYAVQNGWSSAPIAYAPTVSEAFHDALKTDWAVDEFDAAVDYYVNAFARITESDELSNSFQLRFCLGKMVDKLKTIDSTRMVEPSGNLTQNAAMHLVKKLIAHPKTPKYAFHPVSNHLTHLAYTNTVEPSVFLYKLHQNYSEIQQFKQRLLVDHKDFWRRVFSHLEQNTPLFQKNNLVEVITHNYPYPQKPLLNTEILILSQSPYVLKKLFDAGVVATDKDQNANFVDANEQHYHLYSPNQRMTLKERMLEFVSQDTTDDEDVHAAQDLLNIFQRTTLSEHISGTHSVTKRKI